MLNKRRITKKSFWLTVDKKIIIDEKKKILKKFRTEVYFPRVLKVLTNFKENDSR